MTGREAAGPARVTVLGNSCSLQVCSRELVPGDAPYPELLRSLLAVDGVRAEVANHSIWMGTARDAVRDWQVAVWAAWPDLVVLHHGINEARSSLIPRRVHNMTWTLDIPDGRVQRFLVPRIKARWRAMGELVARWDRPFIPSHVSPRRFADYMARVVGQTTVHTTAVCIVIGLNPVNDVMLRAGGAYPVRREEMMRDLESIVAKQPQSALIRREDVQDEIGDSKRTFPDGIHLSPLGHRVLAERIANTYRELRARRDSE
ncbi:MAG: SGNH/GDSL hydrolase family protein [Mycobacteriales bacterium]